MIYQKERMREWKINKTCKQNWACWISTLSSQRENYHHQDYSRHSRHNDKSWWTDSILGGPMNFEEAFEIFLEEASARTSLVNMTRRNQ